MGGRAVAARLSTTAGLRSPTARSWATPPPAQKAWMAQREQTAPTPATRATAEGQARTHSVARYIIWEPSSLLGALLEPIPPQVATAAKAGLVAMARSRAARAETGAMVVSARAARFLMVRLRRSLIAPLSEIRPRGVL